LLEKDPVKRCQTIQEIMEHSWFDDVDWKKVILKQVKPPMVPDINSCYFENQDDKEESDESHNMSSLRQSIHGNASRGNIRRQSCYVQQTVNL